MKEQDPDRNEVLDLARRTREASIRTPLFSVSHHRKLRNQWAAMLEACRPKAPDADVNWDEVRRLLRECVPEDVRMDERFQGAMWSILVDCVGAREGIRGANVLFAAE